MREIVFLGFALAITVALIWANVPGLQAFATKARCAAVAWWGGMRDGLGAWLHD